MHHTSNRLLAKTAMLPISNRTFIHACNYLGVAPMALLAMLMWLVNDHAAHGFVAMALTSLAGLLVAFTGGVHWGITLRLGNKAPKFHLIWGAIAAFGGWFGMLMLPGAGMPFLATMFVACYVADHRSWPKVGLQEWLTLRFHTTVVAVVSCLIGAAGTM